MALYGGETKLVMFWKDRNLGLCFSSSRYPEAFNNSKVLMAGPRMRKLLCPYQSGQPSFLMMLGGAEYDSSTLDGHFGNGLTFTVQMK